MTGYLSQNQIDYVLYHLSFHLKQETYRAIRSRMVFVQREQSISLGVEGKIFFELSSAELDLSSLFWIEGLPVLFPLDRKETFFTMDHGTLVFHHDLLKSVFYLLSGYQEYGSDEKDQLQRFPYTASIQHKLGILNKPVVNYYFEVLISGLERFCQHHHLPFNRDRMFDSWQVMLTHDVDRIDTYTPREWLYKAKQVAGLAPLKYSFSHHLRLFWRYSYGLLMKSGKNPHWDLYDIIREEAQYGYQSAFYFLRPGLRNQDASYSLNENRIKRLFSYIDQSRGEIGLHGTVRSSYDQEIMNQDLEALRTHSPQEPAGVRQHRLLYKHPRTLKIQKSAGLKYDTTLGYAGHEGFRNSYCLPFKLFDFEKDQMIDLWEIPLVAMDGTLFIYRGLNADQAESSILSLIDEIRAFNGIFTFLWHNGFESDNPDKAIRSFYSRLLKLFNDQGALSILGKDLIKNLEHSKTFKPGNFTA